MEGQAADHRFRRRGAVGLGVLALVVGAGLWLALRTTTGPLVPPEGSSRESISARIGDRLSMGVDSPTYHGSAVIVIDALVPDSVPVGLRVLGYRAIAWGEGSVGAARGFPPTGLRLQRVDGSRVLPGQGAQITIGLEPLRAGVLVIPGFTLRYHIGWHRYAAHYLQAVQVCVASPGGTPACSGT